MADRQISQQQLDELIEDALYLQDEAEAMQYVIDDVPYAKTPPEGESIAEMLLLIDHAQLSYYRPILEQTVKNPRPTHLENFIHFKENFEADEEKINDVHKILRKLAKHRAGLVNSIRNVPLIDWESIIYKNNQEILLLDFLQQMIEFERGILKNIAEQVMAYTKEKENRREIEQRRPQRGNQKHAENN